MPPARAAQRELGAVAGELESIPLPALPPGLVVVEVGRGDWEVREKGSDEPVGRVLRRSGCYEAHRHDMILARPRGFAAAVSAILASRRGV